MNQVTIVDSSDFSRGSKSKFQAVRGISPFNETAPCRGCPEVLETLEDRNLLVFISFSVPLETWKDFSAQMEKTGGVFIVRGVPKESFELFAFKVLELLNEGVLAPIDIDPELFLQYGISEAPAVVLRDGKKYDMARGNLRLSDTLRLFSEEGETKNKALQLLEKLNA